VHSVRVVAEADATGVADAVLDAVDEEPVQVLTAPAEGDCNTACRPATVMSAGISSRRQISGLTPRTTTRSWYTLGRGAGSMVLGMRHPRAANGWPGRAPPTVCPALPHSHDSVASVDSALEGSTQGIRAVKISLVLMAATAVLQLLVVLLSGSVALLADTVHNFSDALTAVPLWIAFLLSRRAASRRYTYGYGRVEDLAGLFIVAMIALSAVIAGWEAVDRLIHPAPSSTSAGSPSPGSSASSATNSSRSTGSGSAGASAPPPWSPPGSMPGPMA